MRPTAGGHALDLPGVRDAEQQDAAFGIGKGGEFVRQVRAARCNRTVVPELYLLELPEAVLAQSKLLPDIRNADSHGSLPGAPASAPSEVCAVCNTA